jgi:hypothetical protein
VKAVRLERSELIGATELAVQALLTRAFTDVDDDYYSIDKPERIVLLLDDDRLIGHIALTFAQCYSVTKL